MRVVIWQDKRGEWHYDKDTLVEADFDGFLDWTVDYYVRDETEPRNAKIVEIPDLPDPNTLA